jgi:hypothetical protein
MYDLTVAHDSLKRKNVMMLNGNGPSSLIEYIEMETPYPSVVFFSLGTRVHSCEGACIHGDVILTPSPPDVATFTHKNSFKITFYSFQLGT